MREKFKSLNRLQKKHIEKVKIIENPTLKDIIKAGEEYFKKLRDLKPEDYIAKGEYPYDIYWKTKKEKRELFYFFQEVRGTTRFHTRGIAQRSI